MDENSLVINVDQINDMMFSRTSNILYLLLYDVLILLGGVLVALAYPQL